MKTLLPKFFAARAAQAGCEKQPVSEGIRRFRAQRVEMRLHMGRGHTTRPRADFLRVGFKAPQTSRRGSREKTQRKDGSLMRVHAARRVQHGFFGFHAQRAKGGKRVGLFQLHTRPRAFAEVRLQRARASKQHFKAHIRMRPIVSPIDQARLRRGFRFANQRAHGGFGDALRQRRPPPFVDSSGNLPRKLRNGMRPAARARKRGLSAQKTASRRKSQRRTTVFLAVSGQYVQIEQPPERLLILYAAHFPLDGFRVRVQRNICLRPGKRFI